MNSISSHDDTTCEAQPGTVLIPRVLSIAGTDPTGGAGIQADLKSIAANGGYGMAVVTALVAQNTTGVRSIHVPPVEFLREQLHTVSDDVTIDAVKIGMLFDADIVATVADWLQESRPPVVVLDPVMIAASGDRLLADDAEDAIRGLLAAVDLVTPNIPELAILLGEPVATTWEEALEQAHRLSRAFGVRILAKGGHLDAANAPDALVDVTRGTVTEFNSTRINTQNTHGTGCSLSAAVATLHTRFGAWEPAIQQAKIWLTESIQAADGLHVGQGSGPISHFAGLWRRAGTTPHTARTIARDWWHDISDIRNAIDDLSFIRGLATGSLEEDAFVWYLAQDALYLRDYSRVLAQASKLAPTPAEQAFWASSAHGAIATELELHSKWLPSDELFDAAPSRTTTEYLNHLLATAARGNYTELIAAVLPCFWIYVDVGARLKEHATPQNPYAAWLQTYGDPDFEELNRQAVQIVTSHAASATVTEQRKMQDAFNSSARHELNFFAAPLQRESRQHSNDGDPA